MDDVGMKATTDLRVRSIASMSTASGWTPRKRPTPSSRRLSRRLATSRSLRKHRGPRISQGVPRENLVAGSVIFTPPDQEVPLDNRCAGGPMCPAPTGGIHAGRRAIYEDATSNPSCMWPIGRGGLCAMGGEAAADRGRVGVRRARRTSGSSPVGRHVCPAGTHDEHHQGHFPHEDTVTRLHGHRTRRSTRRTLRFARRGRQCLGMGQRLVSTGLLRATRDGRRRQKSPRPGIVVGPGGARTPKRVHRGGSFLCSDSYCSRYMVGTRGKGDVTTGTNHLGFRLVKPAPGA